ncbi:MAG: hypothetical protein GY929_08995 [Actinomycetia bacterium]|nr:hypothetical protein [Actinomycetes bacterium]
MPSRSIADARAALAAAYESAITVAALDWQVRTYGARAGDGQQKAVTIELQWAARNDDPFRAVFTVRIIADGSAAPELGEANLDPAMDLCDAAMPSDVNWGGWGASRYDEDSQQWVVEGTARAARDWPPT